MIENDNSTNPTDRDPQPASPEGSAKTTNTAEEPQSEKKRGVEGFFDTIADGINKGADRAADAACDAAPKVKNFFRTGAYKGSFGLAYGVAFGATLARELVPTMFREGVSDGVSAGSEAAKKFTTREGKNETAANEVSGEVTILPPPIEGSPA